MEEFVAFNSSPGNKQDVDIFFWSLPAIPLVNDLLKRVQVRPDDEDDKIMVGRDVVPVRQLHFLLDFVGFGQFSDHESEDLENGLVHEEGFITWAVFEVFDELLLVVLSEQAEVNFILLAWLSARCSTCLHRYQINI